MAYNIIRKESAPGFDHLGGYTEYICAATSDVANLPTGTGVEDRQAKPRPGSMAVVCNPPSLYTLSPARQWKKLWESEV